MTQERSKLGIIAGKGLLPSEIAALCVQNGRECCIAAIFGESDVCSFSQFQYKEVPMGSVGSLFEYFNENNVKEIVIVGSIIRPDLKSIKVDMTGSLLIAKILKNKFLGDDSILQLITKFIESKGFKVISPIEILKISNYQERYTSKNTPSAQDDIDIKIGINVLNNLGAMDVGQSVIVANGLVLGIEAAEGTDELIRRCQVLRKDDKGGVLVKMSKTSQDMRLDVPTIGPDTIFYLAKHGYNGIALETSRVIIAKPLETIELLNSNDLFINYV